MPPVRCPRHSESRIWEQNESTIRHLYQTERKTLKQVKEIMEIEHGFPIMPLTIYETRLRDVLGLRKKLKKADWTAIHQHYQSREGKDTGIYLNGSRIPWEKAWKEIRRSGARSAGSDTTLPPGVVVRTPSPAGPSTFTPPQVRRGQSYERCPPSLNSPLQELCDRPFHKPLSRRPDDLVRHHQGRQYPSTSTDVLPWHITAVESLKLATIQYSVCLSDMPWNTFKDRILSAGFIILQMDINMHENWKVAFSSATFPLLHQDTASSLPASNFDIYHFLARAIYLLSNNMVVVEYSFDDQCPDVFKILLSRVPRRVLIGLFQIDHPTIRATWEALVYCAGVFAYRDSFNFLIGVGIQHPGWVVPRGASYLALAASMAALDVVRSLLKAGARADGDIGQSEQSPLVEAAATGNLECVKLLLGACDANRGVQFGYYPNTPKTTLSLFVGALVMRRFWTPAKQDHAYLSSSLTPNGLRVDFDLENELQARGLTMLLESGANVDSKPYLAFYDTGFFESKRVPMEWRPTILEWSYYRNTKVFHALVPYSTRRMGYVNRTDIWLSAKQGQKVLDEYLMSRPSDPGFDTTKFLELVLAEQFMSKDAAVDTKVVQGLIEFGVDPNRASSPKDINYFLRCLVSTAWRLPSEDFVIILRLLLHHGAVINEQVWQASIENEGINTLLVLSQHDVDVAIYGGIALSKAACLNNYEAVSWLLDAGVDINAEVVNEWPTEDFQPRSVISLANSQLWLRLEWDDITVHRSASCAMLEYLIECGAELKNGPEDATSFFFLLHFLSTTRNDSELVKKMKVFLDLKLDDHDLLGPGCLLQACLSPTIFLEEAEREGRLAVFELLLERGVPAMDDSVLPSLIYYGGRHETIRKLLKDGIDINVYTVGSADDPSYTPVQAAACRGDIALVVDLALIGADINRPAAGGGGRTALQAACELDTKTTVERAKKMELIQFLIERGAEINAPAAPWEGVTALQCAAINGDMEVALLLLHHGADVNGLPDTLDSCSALDGAARNGRLDMVKFLLNAGALSYDRGHTGYEGAIHEAESERHFAVADLIREHVANNEKWFGVNLAMTF
ncbi:ankyrin [Hypoxylon cercidicola]|nr:ankyrin [Hypoxylon cercidicola]